MKKTLKVISVDGTRGAGKTNQINMLAKHFRTLNLDPLIVKSEANPECGLSALKTIDVFLSQNDKGMVIVDGSIARPMVMELIEGKPSTQVIDRYKHATHDYEKIDKKYGIVGILFVMDDIKEANNRLLKRSTLAGTDEVGMASLDKEQDIVSGMRTFNNHIASKSMEFHTFNIEPADSMMSIHREVLSYLSSKFDIPVLKKTEDDW